MQKGRAKPSDGERTHVIHLCTRVCVENILLFISTYKDIQNILVTTHIHFFFWKEYLHACSRYCAKITYVHILTILLPQTTHTHWSILLTYKFFVVPFLFIYTFMRIGEPISRHAHTCIWKETFMPSTYSWGAIPHHIFIWEAFSCHLWHGYIFFERLLILLDAILPRKGIG